MDSPQNNVITLYLSLAGTWYELRLNLNSAQQAPKMFIYSTTLQASRSNFLVILNAV